MAKASVWLLKALASKVALTILAAFGMLLFWCFLFGWFVTGSAVKSAGGSLKLLRDAAVGLGGWAVGLVPAAVGSLLESGWETGEWSFGTLTLGGWITLFVIFSIAWWLMLWLTPYLWRYSGMEFLFALIRAGLRLVAVAAIGETKTAAVARWWGSDYLSYDFRLGLWIIAFTAVGSWLMAAYFEFGVFLEHPQRWIFGGGIWAFMVFAALVAGGGMIWGDIRMLRDMWDGYEYPDELVNREYPRG